MCRDPDCQGDCQNCLSLAAPESWGESQGPEPTPFQSQRRPQIDRPTRAAAIDRSEIVDQAAATMMRSQSQSENRLMSPRGHHQQQNVSSQRSISGDRM